MNLNGFEIVIGGEALQRKLDAKKRLRVKLGIDPTSSEIHLGFWVLLRKFKEFIDEGHECFLLMGDFTAGIGDPSGRSATRKQMTQEEIAINASKLLDQINMVIPEGSFNVVSNVAWWDPQMWECEGWIEEATVSSVFQMASTVTVNQLLQRDDFAKRFTANEPIFMHELLYPLVQAQDSVFLEADVELGGTDQLFNCLLGRDQQERNGQSPQAVLLTTILRGIDGVQKMSKSLGNSIGITEPPLEVFSKTMSIPDNLMQEWFKLITGDTIDQTTLDAQPFLMKIRLAGEITKLLHGGEKALEAMQEWEKIHSKRELPKDIQVVRVTMGESLPLSYLLMEIDFTKSISEGKRSIAGGSVRFNGEQIRDITFAVTREQAKGAIVQLGRRKFAKINVREEI